MRWTALVFGHEGSDAAVALGALGAVALLRVARARWGGTGGKRWHDGESFQKQPKNVSKKPHKMKKYPPCRNTPFVICDAFVALAPPSVLARFGKNQNKMGKM